MTTQEIDTSPPQEQGPWAYARKVFVRLLLGGVAAMVLIGYTDYQEGLSTAVDKVMLPILAVVSLLVALLLSRSDKYMKPALGFNCVLLIIYYEGLLFQAVQSSDPVSTYSMASIAQFMPGLYIALFVFLNRHAALACWILYGTVAAQCGYGLYLTHGDEGVALQRQIYWAVLASHPCCIIVLSFMNHLRSMVESAKQEALASKERFLAVVSHEVRTPLQTIVSSLELVETTPPGPLLTRAIRRIMGAASMLETQIRDLTAFTKLELSPELHPTSVDLHQLAATIELTFQAPVQQKGLSLRLDLPAEPMVVDVDEARLRQILDNLIGNAIKYTESGHITLGLRRDNKEWVHWWVQDTGRGIPPDRIAQVFEPFVRIKSNPKERIEGSGLGLAVVRQLVGLMAGRIQVESAMAQGTTMHIRLPLADKPNTPFDATTNKPKRVLIVDDDIDILYAIRDLLQEWGVNLVATASDGLSACQMLREQSFDVALIDLQLPGASGYEVAQSARLHGPNGSTPLVAMSAASSCLDKAASGSRAFCAYMPKPVNLAALKQTLMQATKCPTVAMSGAI